MSIADNLGLVLAEIAEACRRCEREAEAVSLVAVSKAWDSDVIRPALEAGHRLFGENRVQEAQAKWPGLKKAFPDTVLHLVGHLQTNKTSDAVALFDLIETVDRPKLATVIAKEQEKQGRVVECYVQINTGEEPRKGGVAPAEAPNLLRQCSEAGLNVTGLMCVPPADQEPAPHFALLAKMAREHGLPNLSMGMSADFSMAIEQRATHVRVGTAIFGKRKPPKAG